MKKYTWLLLLLLLPASSAWAQAITTYPYFENFDALAGCGTICGNVCDVSPVNWINSTDDDLDWTVRSGPTPSSFSTGPFTDHTTGTAVGNYLYTETSGAACQNATALLISPEFDLSSLTTPQVSFWYHMRGNTMGTMHFDVSADDGATWDLDVFPSWTDDIDLWQLRNVTLCDYVGETSVRFRIRGETGGGFNSDMAIDDFGVGEAVGVDLSLTSISSPISGTGLTASEPVTITITNTGATTLAAGENVPVSFQVDAGAPVNEVLTLSAPLPPCSATTYTFTAGADLSANGIYLITAEVNLAGDIDASNNTRTRNVINTFLVTSFPYEEDFEDGPGGWINTDLHDWQLGDPTVPAIAPFSGANCWVTNLTGNYVDNGRYILMSPIFDMAGSGYTAADFGFYLAYDIQNGAGAAPVAFDILTVQYSSDGGDTWTQLGDVGTGFNWFNNDNPTAVLDPSISAGWSDNNDPATTLNWAFVAHPIPPDAMASSTVLFRYFLNSNAFTVRPGAAIDDVIITDELPRDLALTAINLPEPATGLGVENIEVELSNLIGATAEEVTIQFDIAGPDGTTTFTETYTGLGLGSGTSVLLNTTFDFSTPGTYNVVATIIDPPTDLNPNNNSINGLAAHLLLVSEFPYFENFDDSPGGWYPESNLDRGWEYGTPSTTIINSAFSPPNAWVTLLDANYQPSAFYELFTPTFNFSTFVLPEQLPVMQFRNIWQMASTFPGTNNLSVDYSTDGGTTWERLGEFGDGLNWYNNATDVWVGNSGGEWLQSVIFLPAALTGQADVRFRFVLQNTSTSLTFNNEGWAIDDFGLTTTPDIAVIDITNPVDGSSVVDLVDPVPVTVVLQNIGAGTITNPELSYIVDGASGPTTHTEIATGVTMGPLETATYTFATPAEFLVLGNYTLTVVATEIPGEANIANNSFTINLIHAPLDLSDSCEPDLEEPEGWVTGAFNGWTPNDDFIPVAATSWELGVPNDAASALPAFNGVSPAPIPPNAWVTNLTGDFPPLGSTAAVPGSLPGNGTSRLTSPMYDFSDLVLDPVLSFELAFRSNNWDILWVEYSFDGGTTWEYLDQIPGSINWYNQPPVASVLGATIGGRTANTDHSLGNTVPPLTWGGGNGAGPGYPDWTYVERELVGFAGQPSVRFRLPYYSTNVIENEGWAIDAWSIGCIPLGVPTMEVTLTEVSCEGVLVEWIDDSDVETGFLVQRTLDLTGATGWVVVGGGVLPANTTSIQDNDVLPGQTYLYRVNYVFPAGVASLPNETATIVLTQAAAGPFLDLGPDLEFCEREFTLQLDATNPLQDGPITFQWFENGEAIPGGALLSRELTADTTDAPITNQYVVRATNAEGCVRRDTINVTYHLAPIPQPLDTVISADATLEANLFNENPGDVIEYAWYKADDLTTPIGTERTILIQEIGEYVLEVERAGCPATLPFTVGCLEPPMPIPALIEDCGVVELDATLTDGVASDITGYTWYKADAFPVVYSTGPQATFIVPGDYSLQIDRFGCTFMYDFKIVCDTTGVPGEGDARPPYRVRLVGEPGSGEAYLTWNAPEEEDNVAYFEIYGFDVRYLSTKVGETEDNKFTVNALLNGIKYDFAVRPILRTEGRNPYVPGARSNVVTVYPSIVLANEAENAANTLKVFPNPNEGRFRLQLDHAATESFKVTIVNAAGQVIHKQSVKATGSMLDAEIDLQNVASGLYILKVESDTHTYQQKISITK
ncbi:MAG: T9SS type A sorting domain-containing protein [Bernardetiaceae bacterium]|nr:T9SS type A sorting domain-containing protein [Bernardetiaceae bacterium]